MQSFDKSKFTKIQKREFESLPKQAKDLVCKGHLVKVISLESEEEICSFNNDTYKIPKSALDSFARAVLPDIVEYYGNKKKKILSKNKSAHSTKSNLICTINL